MIFVPFSECPSPNSELNQRFHKLMDMTAQTGKEYYTLSENLSFHTHPKGTPYPSLIDMNTAVKLEKPMMCIGQVPQRETTCWSVPNFGQVCRFAEAYKDKLERCIMKVKADNKSLGCSEEMIRKLGGHGKCVGPHAICRSSVKR